VRQTTKNRDNRLTWQPKRLRDVGVWQRAPRVQKVLRYTVQSNYTRLLVIYFSTKSVSLHLCRSYPLLHISDYRYWRAPVNGAGTCAGSTASGLDMMAAQKSDCRSSAFRPRRSPVIQPITGSLNSLTLHTVHSTQKGRNHSRVLRFSSPSFFFPSFFVFLHHQQSNMMQVQQPLVYQSAPGQYPAGQPVYAAAPGQPVYAAAPGQHVVYQQQQPVVYQQQVMQPQSGVLIQPGSVGGGNVPGQMVVGMAMPPAPAGTPPGLEYFAVLDSIWCMQKASIMELVTNLESNSKFQCLNSQGLQVYYASERNDCCTRNCLGSMRPWLIEIYDPANRVVMKVTRPYRFNSVWQPFGLPFNACCLQEVTVTDVNNAPIGRIVQKYSIFGAHLEVQDEAGQQLVTIKCPFFTCPCFSDVDFPIFKNPADPTPFARIVRKYRGLAREAFLQGVDSYNVQFPMDLPIKTKALLFCASFLIDFMYYEKKAETTTTSVSL